MNLGVSIITSTNRPQFFDNILANYRNQQYQKKELIIILNKNSMNLKDYREKARSHKNVSVYKLPEKISLGYCLNFAVKKAKFPLIAKFDDDDYYSRYYLTEQTKALSRTGSDVVGKNAYLAYLESSKKLILRFPMQKHKFIKIVQGSTILFRKRIEVRFANRSLGEDVNFMMDCKKKGYRVYATSPYNYVYVRRKNRMSHTWPARDSLLLRGSKLIAVTNHFRAFAVRKN